MRKEEADMRRNDITKKIMNLTKEVNRLVDDKNNLEIDSKLISRVLEMDIARDYLDAKRGYYVIEYKIDNFEFTYTLEDLCNYNFFKITDNVSEINTKSAKLNALYTIYKLEMELVVNIEYKLNDKVMEKDFIVKTWKITCHKDVSRFDNKKMMTSDSLMVENLYNKNREEDNIDNEQILNTYSKDVYDIIDNAIEKEFRYKFNNSIPSEEFKKDITALIESSMKEHYVSALCHTGHINSCIKSILSNMWII